MAMMMSGLCCFGLLCCGRNLMGIMVGWFIVSLSFCSPSCVGSMVCREWSCCGRDVFFVRLGFEVSHELSAQVHVEDWPSTSVM